MMKKSQVIIACDHCHNSKKKCDLSTPCSRCKAHGVECVRKRNFKTKRKAAAMHRNQQEDEEANSPSKLQMIATSATSNEQLNSATLFQNMVDVAMRYFVSLYSFATDYANPDINSLYSTPARQVRTDAILGMTARGMGLDELSAELMQRSLRRSNQVALEMSMDSASAMLMLGTGMFGRDINIARHLFRASRSIYQELHPDEALQEEAAVFGNQGSASAAASSSSPAASSVSNESAATSMSHDSDHVLFIKALQGFRNPHQKTEIKEIHRLMNRNKPLVAWHVRDALARHNVPSSYGPFDMAQYMGVKVTKPAAAAAAAPGLPLSNASSPSSPNESDEDGLLLVAQLGDLLVASELKGKMVEVALYYALVQWAMQFYSQGDIENCKTTSIAALQVLEDFPPQMLPSSSIMCISQIYELSILLEDLQMFHRIHSVSWAMRARPSALAVHQAMNDTPSLYPMRIHQNAGVNIVEEQEEEAAPAPAASFVHDVEDFSSWGQQLQLQQQLQQQQQQQQLPPPQQQQLQQQQLQLQQQQQLQQQLQQQQLQQQQQQQQQQLQQQQLQLQLQQHITAMDVIDIPSRQQRQQDIAIASPMKPEVPTPTQSVRGSDSL